MARLNVLVLVVDSLRYDALRDMPWLANFDHQAKRFDRAYATDCWTLPATMSMFTGRLPGEHGAHFGHMGRKPSIDTIAEIVASRGAVTQLVARNHIFDGSIPGPAAGFRRRFQPMADLNWLSPLGIGSALAKPRLRRVLNESGFFTWMHRRQRDFVKRMIRMGLPADQLALDLTLMSLKSLKQARKRHFTFVNLFDVHAPYVSRDDAPVGPPTSWENLEEIIALHRSMPRIYRHEYLQPGFALNDKDARVLRRRYRAACRAIDKRLQAFVEQADALQLLKDTVLIIASDHGEAFGEHGLWGHDASLYDTHLHVPLFVRWPGEGSGRVTDVVSAAGVARLVETASLGYGPADTILDPRFRSLSPAAMAEHFPYRRQAPVLEKYRLPQACVIVGDYKVVTQEGVFYLRDLTKDPAERERVPFSGTAAQGLFARYVGQERAVKLVEFLRRPR